MTCKEEIKKVQTEIECLEQHTVAVRAAINEYFYSFDYITKKLNEIIGKDADEVAEHKEPKEAEK